MNIAAIGRHIPCTTWASSSPECCEAGGDIGALSPRLRNCSDGRGNNRFLQAPPVAAAPCEDEELTAAAGQGRHREGRFLRSPIGFFFLRSAPNLKIFLFSPAAFPVEAKEKFTAPLTGNENAPGTEQAAFMGGEETTILQSAVSPGLRRGWAPISSSHHLRSPLLMSFSTAWAAGCSPRKPLSTQRGLVACPR